MAMRRQMALLGLLAAALGVALLSLPARGAGEAAPYSRQVRFQRGEHPRIWVTRADLPAMRARCAPGGTHAREFARLKDYMDRQIARGGSQGTARALLFDPVPIAFLYLVTGERRYAETVKGILAEGRAEKYAGVALDWILAKSDRDTAPGVPVTPEELAALARKLTGNETTFAFYDRRIGENPMMSGWRYRIPGTFFACLALLHEGVDDARFATALDWVMDWVKNEWIAGTNRLPRGVYYPGFDYYRYSSGTEARVAVAWKVAAGEDLFRESVQLREFPRHAFYQHDPRTGIWVHYEQGRSGVNVSSIMPVYGHACPDPVVRRICQYFENRRVPESFWTTPEPGHWDDVVVKIPGLWERILWYDPAAPEVDLKAIPTAAYWPGNGYSSFRSGWGRDDTILFFVAGDHVNEHQRLNQGHFGIYRKGWLATTSSSYDSCWEPDEQYGSRTIANNCLLVHDPLEIFWDGYGNLTQKVNDGGQYMFFTGACAWGGNWRERKKDDVWDVADTVAFESQPLYDYVAGDLTNAYRKEVKDSYLKDYEPERIKFTPNGRPNKLTRCTRQILYLKPDVFVIFDRVDSVDPSFTKTWLLHTMNEPQVEGRELRALPAEGATEYDGSFLSAEHQEGKLMAKRLLPAKAVVRKRGGKGFEAWAGGRNWPHSSGRLYGWEYSALWRVEEEPVEKRKEDVFLHVLYACDKGTGPAAMPRCELAGGEASPGARIDYLGRAYEVSFERGGGRACAGRIRVLQGRETLVENNLAQGIRPPREAKP